jgi:hypothetical protein
MTSLANWAKYTGRYDKFQQIKQRYNLKWLRVDSTIHLQRFFNEGLTLDVMTQRIRQMIRLPPERMAKIIKYACLVGLHASEVLESVKVINNGDKEAFVQYYDSVQLTLNHWKLPGMIRSTKESVSEFYNSPNATDCTKYRQSTNFERYHASLSSQRHKDGNVPMPENFRFVA